MTGEVTLQGRVLPIGGVKQKVLAAHAAGLTDVILPERNRGDLDEVPADVREQMRFHLVKTRRRGAARWRSRPTRSRWRPESLHRSLCGRAGQRAPGRERRAVDDRVGDELPDAYAERDAVAGAAAAHDHVRLRRGGGSGPACGPGGKAIGPPQRCASATPASAGWNPGRRAISRREATPPPRAVERERGRRRRAGRRPGPRRARAGRRAACGPRGTAGRACRRARRRRGRAPRWPAGSSASVHTREGERGVEPDGKRRAASWCTRSARRRRDPPATMAGGRAQPDRAAALQRAYRRACSWSVAPAAAGGARKARDQRARVDGAARHRVRDGTASLAVAPERRRRAGLRRGAPAPGSRAAGGRSRSRPPRRRPRARRGSARRRRARRPRCPRARCRRCGRWRRRRDVVASSSDHARAAPGEMIGGGQTGEAAAHHRDVAARGRRCRRAMRSRPATAGRPRATSTEGSQHRYSATPAPARKGRVDPRQLVVGQRERRRAGVVLDVREPRRLGDREERGPAHQEARGRPGARWRHAPSAIFASTRPPRLDAAGKRPEPKGCSRRGRCRVPRTTAARRARWRAPPDDRAPDCRRSGRARHCRRLLELADVEVAHAPGADHAGLPQLLEAGDGLRERVRTRPVQEVAVRWSVRSRRRLRSQAATTPWREALRGRTLRHQVHVAHGGPRWPRRRSPPRGRRRTSRPCRCASDRARGRAGARPRRSVWRRPRAPRCLAR